jgi:hypothetical protein
VSKNEAIVLILNAFFAWATLATQALFRSRGNIGRPQYSFRQKRIRRSTNRGIGRSRSTPDRRAGINKKGNRSPIANPKRVQKPVDEPGRRWRRPFSTSPGDGG